MVAKLEVENGVMTLCIILAKIHMVAKPRLPWLQRLPCIILAKIHMVAKLMDIFIQQVVSIILAKIHMVAKPQKYYSITFDIKIYQSFTF